MTEKSIFKPSATFSEIVELQEKRINDLEHQLEILKEIQRVYEVSLRVLSEDLNKLEQKCH